jgi:hypothetical protein
MIGSLSLRTPVAVIAATASLTGLALAVGDQARSVVDMAPLGVWFANDAADSVSHIGPAGADATVRITGATGQFKVTTLDGTAYVADAAGRLVRVDPAQLVVSQQTSLPSATTQLVGGGGRLYAVDPASGTVRELDPIGMTTIGETARLGTELGAAVVDDDGVLWVSDRASGGVIAVDGRSVTGNRPVARPGEEVRLSVVNGVVVAINPSTATVTQVAGDRVGETHQIQVAAGAAAPAVVAGTSVLPVVSGNNLVTLDLRNGRTIRVELAATGHRLGTPAIAANRVYVPDFTAGTLLVVDLATNAVVDTLTVTGRAGVFELVVESGRVFVNDPETERAWAINSAGQLVEIAKYDPTQSGGGNGNGSGQPATTTTTTTVAPTPTPTPTTTTTVPRNNENRPTTTTTVPRNNENRPTTTTTVPRPAVVVVPPPTTRPPNNNGGGNGNGTSNTTTTTTTTTTTVPVDEPDGAVLDLVAVPGDRSVTLSWRAPSEWGPPTGYRVVVDPSGAAFDVAGDATTLPVPGLTNGRPYRFTVTARSARGDGRAVRSAEVTPAPAPPDAPVNVAVAPGDNAVTVTWDPPRTGRVTGYRVALVPTGDAPPMSLDTPDTQRTVTFTPLQVGASYYATVRAVVDDRPGATASSPVFTAVASPGAPVGVGAYGNGPGTITVTWSAPPANGSPISGYTITTAAGFSQAVAADRTSFDVTGLTVGSQHTFRVSATNAIGRSPEAPAPVVVVESLVPGAPGSVTATPGDGSATLTWTAAPRNGSTIANYRVRNVTLGSAPAIVPGSSTSYPFTGLGNGTNYTFEVQAISDRGAAGPPVQASAVPFGALTGPTNVAVTALSPVAATVTFDAPPTDNGQTMRHWIVDTVPSSPRRQTVTSGSATITGLSPSTTYTFEVIAVGIGGATASRTIQATTPSGVPLPVTGLEVLQSGLNNVEIFWDPNPLAEWYMVDPGDASPPFRVDAPTTSATWDPPNLYSAVYTASVTAWSSYGSAALVTVQYWMPEPYEPPECGYPTRRICP